MSTIATKVVGPKDGKAGFLGSIGVRFMVDGDESGGALLAGRAPDVAASARSSSAPPSARGRVQLRARGPRRRAARRRRGHRRAGDLIFKPRNQWHTFWNAGDEPARLLEIISPAGFERFFDELVDLGGALAGRPEGARRAVLALRARDGSRQHSRAARAVRAPHRGGHGVGPGRAMVAGTHGSRPPQLRFRRGSDRRAHDDRHHRPDQALRRHRRAGRRQPRARRRRDRPARRQRRRQVDADAGAARPRRARRRARPGCSASTRSRAACELRRRIGYMPEHECLPSWMTARDLVVHLGELRGLPRRHRGAADERGALPGRARGGAAAPDRDVLDRHAPARQARAGARALARAGRARRAHERARPAGPRGDAASSCRRLSRDLGIRVLFSSHVLEDVERTCDAVVVLRDGRVAAQGRITRAARTRGGQRAAQRGRRPRGAARRAHRARRAASRTARRAGCAVHGDPAMLPDAVRDACADAGVSLRALLPGDRTLEDAVIGAIA